ncbi:Origin recognition complex subunit 5 [Nymphon striatum]|nr:Origin recognition complex subunit 5 [Nymphon striatum]
MENLSDRILFRKEQIDLLSGLIGTDESEIPWPCIYIYGHQATGKSFVTKAVLDSLPVKYVIINCVEVYFNPRLLYEQILNVVSGFKQNEANQKYASCNSMNDFVKSLITSLDDDDQPLCLTQRKICTIFMSEIAWEKFRFGTGFLDPYIIHFNEYNKEELIKILRSDFHSNYSPDLYANYVQLVISIVYQACCNLSELKHIVESNFDKYVQPICQGEATENDVKKLWKNIEPHLIKSLQKIYCRHASISKPLLNGNAISKLSSITEINSSNFNYKTAVIELPFYSKFLLIAAYLSSYNPTRTDTRFFIKATNQLLGPKPFPLDRLLAIFYSIVEERVAPTHVIFSQISSLVTLRLLTSIGCDGSLDVPKYKCSVSLDMIRNISRTVDFDIIRYLYDFI